MKTAGSLKSNTIANYIGLSYTVLIGILILPRYLHYLGAEAFGLIGFFTLLQSWTNLLDMGMSPMLSRQAAHARAKDIDFRELQQLLRSLEIIFFIVALIVVLSITAGSSWIVNNWVNVKSLALTDVMICIVLMGLIIGFRFFSSLYRSGIQGMENQVWLNAANITLVTLKFVGALLLIQFITQDVVDFFIYQLVISIVELMFLAIMFYHFIHSTYKAGIRFFWKSLKPSLPFAGGIAYTATVWVLIMQLDKVIFSTLLPLTEFGYYSLMAVIATGITQISSPINQAMLPRMTYLLSQDKVRSMLAVYRKSTQLMAVIVLPLSGVIALFSTELLFMWTGDRKVAEWAGPLLFWFVLGNGIASIAAFPVFLQFAHGKMRMHVTYISVLASMQIPVIVYVAFEYGALGVAIAWFVVRLFSFLLWTPIVHHKFAPGIHWHWLLMDVAPIFISTAALLLIFNSMNIAFSAMGRADIFLVLFCIWLLVTLVNMLVSSATREAVLTAMKR